MLRRGDTFDVSNIRMGDALRGRPRYDAALVSLRAFVAEPGSGM